MTTSWTADSGIVTADSGDYTADGGSSFSPTSAQYLALIASQHRFRPNFAALVQVLTGALGDIAEVARSLPNVFDIDNAIGVQLDIVGKWVGQSRVVSSVLTLGFFGFKDNPSALGFGEVTNHNLGGVFYEAGATYQSTTTLSDEDYRTVIRARIVKNQYIGNISQFENALQFIFQVPCAVSDIGTRSLAVQISKPITQTQRALLSTLDLLPRPAGVSIGSITYSPL